MMVPPGAQARLTYLLPIRAATPPDPELTRYLRDVSGWCDLLIVDGSGPEVFAAAHAAWASFARHVPPEPSRRCANGKVWGVLTGLDLAESEVVVIADDDVRYGPEELAAVVAALDSADLVVPQNVFVAADGRLPWHARWDTARTLLNRATGGDFPGTLAVRVAAVRRAGGYRGDVLFENLELMRTVRAAGGVVRRVDDVYVARRPPTTHHFLGQRVRQAYDELARPARLAVSLAVVPAVAVAALRRRRMLLALAAAPMALAEVGRRRASGREHFPGSSSLLAPAWVLERGACAWLALAARARGGATYAGGRLVVAASRPAELRRRVAATPPVA